MNIKFRQKDYSNMNQESASYEIHFLSLGDADSIIIRYETDNVRKIILVDAGNLGDGEKIKRFIYNRWATYTIDLAICTHPDTDHKGGFFYLFQDLSVKILEFWAIDPYLWIQPNEYEDRIVDVKRKKKHSTSTFPTPDGQRSEFD